MSPVDAAWHAFHLVLPGLLTGAIAAAFSKMLWRHELRGVRWLRLATWASAAGALGLMGGLLLFGRDGRMATYALMLALTAGALAWAGWGRPAASAKKPPASGRT